MTTQNQLLREALEAYRAAREMPSYGDYAAINWQSQQGPTNPAFGGGDCAKHGRWYGHCYCCADDWEKLRKQADRDAVHARDNALRKADELARAALAQPADGGEAVPKWWMRETEEGFEWTDTAPLVLKGWTPLYTTPPASQEQQPKPQQLSGEWFCGNCRVPVPAPQPAKQPMPEGWVPLTIEHEPGYPEDVAFGPQRMMDRLKKWLDRYFETLQAPKPQPMTDGPAGDWSYSHDEERFHGQFNTKEEAIAEAVSCGARFVGKVRDVREIISDRQIGDDIYERIGEILGEEIGEVAKVFTMTNDQRAALGKVVMDWIESGPGFNCWGVQDVEPIDAHHGITSDKEAK